MVVSGEEEERERCGISRITELPYCIMESIVSRLPLKDAANTILASPPHWKHLSRPILTRRNLEFNNHNIFGSNYAYNSNVKEKVDRALYARRVSKYLQQYEGNKVDSFKIDCRPVTTMSRDEWIRFAITKGVEELHVRVGWSSGKDHDEVFPHNLLVGSTSNHLKHLSLKDCELRHPTSALDVFSRLTDLCLKNVTVDKSLMENLFSVCVLLESLTLKRCNAQDDSSLYEQGTLVAGDRLTHLKVTDSELQATIWDISAPNLASLEYHPHWHESFSLKAPHLSRVVFSYKKLQTTLPEALIEFASCPQLETLHLQVPADILHSNSIPTYGNLKQLHLEIDLDLRYSENEDEDEDDRYRDFEDEENDPYSPFVSDVQDLLKAAPLLEELIILTENGEYLSETNPEATRYDDHSKFANEHLRMVQMQGFRGNWYETELVICILENSPKLEKLIIHESFFSEHPRDVVEEKLKGVKTDAQIIFQ